jgi:translation elongation factor EF-G
LFLFEDDCLNISYLPRSFVSDCIRPSSKLGQALMGAWMPLAPAVLDAVVRHLPSPVEAQAYRVPQIWPGVAAARKGAEVHRISYPVHRTARTQA